MQHSSNLIIYGVTGNLARLKIIPALYDLFSHGKLGEDSLIIGVGRKKYDQTEFCAYIESVITDFAAKDSVTIDPEVMKKLHKSLRYISGDVNEASLYSQLSKMLSADAVHPNTIFYLATYPSLYQTIFEQLKIAGLNKNSRGWVRVLVEKPIGNDLSSAKELNKLMNQYFSEEQIYRLDHYLGKETLQNILYFRFGNSIFEPIFNKEYVDHIQITSSETFGIGARGMYYDNVGALKDVGQNHLLQMLTLVTMDAPVEMTNAGVTAERMKVLKHLKADPNSLVFGQYEGYLQEANVSPESITETFFALKTEVTTERFKGVPIYLRSGKMMDRTMAEISVVFKKPVNQLFQHFESPHVSNVLIFRIQPDEGIAMRFLSKKPGENNVLQSADMEFCYKSLSERLLNPYETLIDDALSGNQTFFNDAEEVEAQWSFIDPLVEAKVRPLPYKPGSLGPKEADELLQKDGREWLVPSAMFCKI